MPFLGLPVFTKMTSETHGARRSTEQLDLRDVIETIPALVLCALADGSAEFANRAWQEYSGRSLQELTGSGWQTTIHSDDIANFFHESTIALVSGKSIETEARLRRADGQYHWFSIRKTLAVSRSQNSEPSLRTLIACEDIDERKQEESARRYSEERHRIVVETANDAVVSIDESSTILFVNPATSRIFGYDASELIGQPLTTLMPDYMRELHNAGFKRYLDTAERHINWQGTELIALRKNSEEFPVEVSLGELAINGRRLFTGFIRDITERKRAEAEARESERRHREMQMEVAHANRIATMGQLTASIAHEIAQPIGSARNNARAALNFLDRQPPDLGEVREALGCVVGDADRARDIIDRIRDHIKKAPPRCDRIDLNKAINEVIVLTRSEITKNGVSVQTRLTEGLFPVKGDPVQVQQVVMNLILNAVEAMSSVEAEVRELLISTEQSQTDGVLVAVRDSGPGINPEQLERVFEAFYTTKSSGVGMGLSICRSIINAHEGRLWADVNEPRGAVFQFTLPNAQGNS
jgi:PAS domain S-box-containing protein